MSLIETTLANLAPGIGRYRTIGGDYHPRKGLAIYYLPVSGYSPASPGMVLGEALSARSGLGCTLLEGVPAKVPSGAVVIGLYQPLKAKRPDLLEDVPEPTDAGAYVIKLTNHAVIAAATPSGLAQGMQTLAMLVLRHNEETLPGLIIEDSPECGLRGLVVELQTGEININLLLQIVSFAATFKTNTVHFLLAEDFDPRLEIPGIEVLSQTAHSYGIGIGVRLPWLRSLVAGSRSLADAWAGLQATADRFGATQAALDDLCPEDIEQETANRIVTSLMKGEAGMLGVEVDARLLLASGRDLRELRELGVTGWWRMREKGVLPGPELDGLPLQLDVEAHLPGFSSRRGDAYHARLNAALSWMAERGGPEEREILVSFRDVGVSHLWQNMLFPAGTGMIAGWGRPNAGGESARLFANLLYGDNALEVIETWDAVDACFPRKLDREQEILVRRIAFGYWPQTRPELELLIDIDWLEVTKHIRVAAEKLRNVAGNLTRNAITLAGAKLSLHALSWLHCYAALMPELARRIQAHDDSDGRTKPIAAELINNFGVWHACLSELTEDSGLDIAEMPLVDETGQQLRQMYDCIAGEEAKG